MISSAIEPRFRMCSHDKIRENMATRNMIAPIWHGHPSLDEPGLAHPAQHDAASLGAGDREAGECATLGATDPAPVPRRLRRTAKLRHDTCSCRSSNAIRTARSRASSDYFVQASSLWLRPLKVRRHIGRINALLAISKQTLILAFCLFLLFASSEKLVGCFWDR